MAKQISWVVGNHAVQAVLEQHPERVIELCVVSNNKLSAIYQQVKSLGIATQTLDKQGLAKRCGIEQNQGIAIQMRAPAELQEQDLMKAIENADSPLLLVLDQVQDPHNFGACLRTAAAAGVNGVVVARDNAAPLTPVVHKVASGATQTVPIYRVTNLVRSLKQLKQAGIWLVGTSDKAQSSLYQQDLTAPLALIMGAEGKGLRKLTEQQCDYLVSLPMASQVVSSLNVSVATGVCLYEIVRQRSQ